MLEAERRAQKGKLGGVNNPSRRKKGRTLSRKLRSPFRAATTLEKINPTRPGLEEILISQKKN